MTWHKYFKPVNSVLPVQNKSYSANGYTSTSKYTSWLPEVYQGPPDRLQRYNVYESMNLDHEIHAALDTLADFSTADDEHTAIPFIFEWDEDPSSAEIQILQKSLKQWCILNDWHTRAWNAFRQTLMYGDQFFIRDPETFKLLWVDPNKVMKVIVNESEGKKIEQYFIRDLDLNLKDLVATATQTVNDQMGSASLLFSPPMGGGANYTTTNYGGAAGNNSFGNQDETPVDGACIVQLTMSDGMNAAWPFGLSALETIYKVYKQKELLEDSILIYRVHRAPERRVFFIDVGSMPPNKAQQYLERIRYEVQQKRIPNRTGGGQNIVDSSYNPMCLSLGTKIPLSDGRILSLSEIIAEYGSGKENFVYSMTESEKVVLAKIDWAGVTRKNSEVLSIILSNGKNIVATPDHMFVLKNGTEIQAQSLTKGMQLLSENSVYVKDICSIAKEDTGDIHINSPTHWFKLDGDIFVHNSMLEDYFFATTCISLNTSIPLLDGRILTLHDLIQEYKEGKVNYTYSQNPDMELEPGKIVWAGVTREHTQVLRIHLDNDEYIDATPDHRFIMRDGTEVEAQHLKEQDSLMPMYVNGAKTSSNQKGKPYLRYIDNASGKIKWVHTAICPKATPGKEFEIHHRDFNSKNNNPDNLVEMATEDHRELHKKAGTYSLKKQWDNPESREKLISGMRKLYDNRTPEFNKMLSERNRKNGKNSLMQIHKSRKLIISEEMLTMFCEVFSKHRFNQTVECAKFLSSYSPFSALFIKYNPNRYSIKNKFISPTKITVENVNKISQTLGYKNFTEFKSQYNYNHKVVSVEWLTETMDTGDITIETPSGSHIFATAAGVFIHNSEGRGSKVETLPGGENLGDIDDLRYFSNKMLRALGVPSSYLPTGPDDGTAGYNDGRVGTAFIQEFRFSKVCERHQIRIIKPLDEEFKLFLKHRGITVDNSMFTIKFTTPQSFSEYRQLELDAAQINVFTAMTDVPYISKRFALKRYLGLSEQEIAENERMWTEEKGSGNTSNVDSANELSSVGITPAGIDDMAPPGGFDDVDDVNDEFDNDINDESSPTDAEVISFGEE